MRRFLSIAAVLALGFFAALPAAQAEVEITYLANEGFLLTAGEHKVLVDALFPGLTPYPSVPEPTRSRLERAEPPFDGVSLVLATHFHDDHFGARQVARHLAASKAIFVSTPQATARLMEELPKDSSADIVAQHPQEGARSALSQPGIELEVLNLHHGRDRDPPVQNLGFLIRLGGVKILHVGDTEVSVDDIRPYRLDREEIDVALLPSWFFGSARWQGVIDAIRARSLVVMHLATAKAPGSWFGSAGSRARRLEQIRSAYPEAWIPTEPLDTRRFAPGTVRMRAAGAR